MASYKNMRWRILWRINRAERFCRLNQRTIWETTVTGGKFSTDVASAHTPSAGAQPAFCLVSNGLTTVAAAYSMAGRFLSPQVATNGTQMYSIMGFVDLRVGCHTTGVVLRIKLASRAAYSQLRISVNPKHCITIIWCDNCHTFLWSGTFGCLPFCCFRLRRTVTSAVCSMARRNIW